MKMNRKPIKILVGESNPLHQRAIANAFSRLGHLIDVVNNGATLMKMVELEPYTHIFVDSKLPQFDCARAAEQLNDAEQRHETTIELIALTTNVFPPYWDKNLFDDSLMKPLQSDALQKCLAPRPQTSRLSIFREW